jgi:hypothetical protein
MDFLLKCFCGVFGLPLPRNARKRTKTGVKKKKMGLVGSSEFNQISIYVKVRRVFFFSAPCRPQSTPGWSVRCYQSSAHHPKTPQWPQTRGAEEKKEKNDVPTYLPFWDFLRFSGPILENIFMVFLGSSCRETAKKAIKQKSMGKDEREKKNLNFFGQKLLTCTFPKKFLMVFLNSPCWETHKSAGRRRKGGGK